MYALGFLIGLIFLFFVGCISVFSENSSLIIVTAILTTIGMIIYYKLQDVHDDRKRKKAKEAEAKAKEDAKIAKAAAIDKAATIACEGLVFPEIERPEIRCSRCGKVIPAGEEYYTDMEHELVCKDCYDRDVGSMIFANTHKI